MKTTLLFSILLFLAFLSGCKKEVRPKIEDTEESKITEFTKITQQSLSQDGVNVLAVPAFAFAFPVEKEFKSSEGYNMIYKVQTKIVKRVSYGEEINLDGIWEYNETSDTLFFIPIQVFYENESIKFLIDIKLCYSDDKNSSYGQKYFRFEKRLKIAKPGIKASPVEYEISPLTNSFEFTFDNKLNEQVNAYNRILKFEIDQVNLIDSLTNKPIGININSPQGNILKIDLKEKLQSYARLKFIFKTKLSELRQGTWQPLLRNSIKVFLYDTIRYKTKIYFLDNHSIEYSYPINRQYYFLKGESTKGFVKLFEPTMITQEGGYGFKARYILLQGDSIDVDLSYNSDSNCFNYSIPQTLLNKKIYRLKFIATKNGSDVVFYDIYFRTSAYNKFEDKFKKLTFQQAFPSGNGGQIIHSIDESTSDECFDNSETSILIKIRDLTDTAYWYLKTDCPAFYKNCREKSIVLTWRKENPIGFPPVRGSFLHVTNKIELTDNEIKINQSSEPKYSFSVYYNFYYYLRKDYDDYVDNLMKYDYTFGGYVSAQRIGKYYYKIFYQLPNGEKTNENLVSFDY